MQAIFFALMGYLVQAAGTIAGRVMVSLGIGLVTYTGVSASLDWGASFIASSMNSLPSVSLQVLGLLGVQRDIAIFLGAISARLVMNGLSSGSLSFWVMRGKLG